MCIDLGWTKDQALDQLDVPFVLSLRKEWRRAPPIRRIAAAWVKYKPPPDADDVPASPGKVGAVSIAALMAALPNGIP